MMALVRGVITFSNSSIDGSVNPVSMVAVMGLTHAPADVANAS